MMTAVSPGSRDSRGAGAEGSAVISASNGVPTVASGMPGVLTTKRLATPAASTAFAASAAVPLQVMSADACELPSW